MGISKRRTTINTTINYSWAGNAPNVYVGADNYSVRWSGQIQARSTGVCTFFINSDDGRRLWINDQLIIVKWISDYGTEKVEYFEEVGGASCMMEWMSPAQPREVVPKSQLYSTISAVKENKFETVQINIYPMPITNKTMHIQLSGFDNSKNVSLVLYDLVGKPILQTKPGSTRTVDLKGVPVGTYIVSVSNEGHIINKRIVVQ